MANKTKQADRHQGTAVFARLPKDLYEKLRAKAKSERRTIGAQLEIIIEAHFSQGVTAQGPSGGFPAPEGFPGAKQ